MAYLSDYEKRILFSALAREKEVCKEIDKDSLSKEIPLTPIVESLERKFYYDRYEKEIRAKAIDECIEISAEAICIGCGYLDGYKCTYNGGNCGVSKPMLEKVVEELKKMKGGAEYNKENDDTDYANIELYNFWLKHQWNLCSEKQPPKPRFKEDSYLIQESDVIAPYSAYWDGECWTDVLNDKIDNVIAWMHLPESYTEGD